ncbi:hypothetical protein EJ08DRAFT_649882 [Tothia fuscella]|uniref:alpha-galactosidase n=1 Tax=Tothia fuscella TaxID=1048955 RepID=A0A9P4TXZ0_9PEZI|nr:hypothetical protein EJ08DRAFT_649882 [Tothia fuscella]
MKPSTAGGGSRWSRISHKLKWTIIAITAAVVILALGLGLGLGLTLGSSNDSDDTGPTAPPLPATPSNDRIWTPAVGASWQIILPQPIKLDPLATSISPDVDIYDIDLFTNPQSTIDTLHRLGKKVICYFSAGSYEPYRPDSGNFKDSDKGKSLDGWPDEKWLDLRSDNVRNIMSKRLELAAAKKCDAIDPDNVDAFDNKNGLGLTKLDSVRFMSFLASKAQSLNLAIGLKNAGAIIPSVLPAIQFSVNEQCVQYKDCQVFSNFVNASKPVFHIEYPSQVKKDFVTNFCQDTGPAQGAHGFSTVIKNYNLDGWVQYCNGQTATTQMGETSS